jgi:hypothetical protein
MGWVLPAGRCKQRPSRMGWGPPAGRCKQRPSRMGWILRQGVASNAPPEWGGVLRQGVASNAPPEWGGVLRQGVASNAPPERGGSSGRALQATPLQNGAGKPLASDHHPLTKSLLISAREAHPHSAIAKKSSSRKIWMTFATPSAPATASP